MSEKVCYYCEGSGYLMRTPKKSRKSLIKCFVCDELAIEGITLEEFGESLKLVDAFYKGKIEDAKQHYEQEKLIDCPDCNAMGFQVIGAGDHEAQQKCFRCKGTGRIEQKRLDRPDREKIAEWLFDRDNRLSHNVFRTVKWEALAEANKDLFRLAADEIITLFPDREEVKVAWIKALMKEGILVAEPKDLAGIRNKLIEYP